VSDFVTRLLATDFAYPWAFALCLLLPIIGFVAARAGKGGAIDFAPVEQLRAMGRMNRVRPGLIMRALTFLGLLSLVLALARPRLPQGELPDSQKGIDVMLVLDFSKSMDAKDYIVSGERVSRLEALSQVIGEFLEGRSHDRFGIIGFAKHPYLTSPLTLDYQWIESALASIQTSGGTAVGEGIHMAIKYLLADEEKRTSANAEENDTEEPWYALFKLKQPDPVEGSRGAGRRQKVLILVSDGISNTGLNPLEAAQIAADETIRIHAIRINPNTVRPNQLEREVMYRVAEATGGAFFQATDSSTLLSIYQQIDQMEKTVIEQKRFQNFEEVYHYPAGLGLLLVLSAFVFGQTIGRRLP